MFPQETLEFWNGVEIQKQTEQYSEDFMNIGEEKKKKKTSYLKK